MARLKTRRGVWFKLLVYAWRGGYPEPHPRWVGQRTDICEDCWEAVLDEVRERVKA